MYIGDVKWLDWDVVPGLLDWVAFVLGGLGIGFTIFQLLRSKGALNAARDALNATRATLIKNQLVAVLPGFREISAEVDGALSGTDREAMSDALVRFGYHAHEASTLLLSSKGFDSLSADILKVSAEASEARAGLYGSPSATVHDLTADAAASIRELALEVSGAAVSIRNDPGNAEGAPHA